MGGIIAQQKLPLLPVKDVVVFPSIYMPLFIGRDFSKKAVFKSIGSHSSQILIVLQKDENKDNPGEMKDFHARLCVIKERTRK